MATDIYNIVGTTIKNGTVVVLVNGPNGVVKTNDAFVVNTPVISDIESKYDSKFDDLGYYCC